MNGVCHLRILAIAMVLSVAGCYPVQDPFKAPLEKTNVVHISNFSYYPPRIGIAAGETVTWINEDSVAHTVTGKYFTSGPILTGQSFSYRFTQPAIYGYYCADHHSMLGLVEVQ